MTVQDIMPKRKKKSKPAAGVRDRGDVGDNTKNATNAVADTEDVGVCICGNEHYDYKAAIPLDISADKDLMEKFKYVMKYSCYFHRNNPPCSLNLKGMLAGVIVRDGDMYRAWYSQYTEKESLLRRTTGKAVCIRIYGNMDRPLGRDVTKDRIANRAVEIEYGG